MSLLRQSSGRQAAKHFQCYGSRTGLRAGKAGSIVPIHPQPQLQPLNLNLQLPPKPENPDPRYAAGFFVPTDRQSWSYKSTEVEVGGRLVPSLSYVHTHMMGFRKGLLVLGSAEDLGLSLQGGCPAAPSAMNCTSSDQLYELLSQRVAESEAAARSKGVVPRLQLLCKSEGLMANVSGSLYDRRATMHCRPVSWQSNTTMTSIVFYDQLHDGSTRDPHRCFSTHNNWYIYYEDPDSETSKFSNHQYEWPRHCSPIGPQDNANGCHLSR